VSKKPQKISSEGILGSFAVVVATDVVKNKTARKRSLSGIYWINVNKIKAIGKILCGRNFFPVFETISGPISE